jgi:hypothetical protein
MQFPLLTSLQAAVAAVDARVFGVFERQLRGRLSHALKLTEAASNVRCTYEVPMG